MVSLTNFRTLNGSVRSIVAVLGLAFTVACGGLGGDMKAPAPTVPAPVILTQPQSMTIEAGKSTSLSVVASGEKLTYTWRKNSVPIAELSSAPIYSFQVTPEDDGAVFTVLVSNPGGSVMSQEAVLTVAQPFQEIIKNGSFETLGANGNAASWTFSDSNMTPKYTDIGLTPPSSAGAMFAVNGYWGEIKNDGYYQTITIPGNASQANLTFLMVVANLFEATPGSPVNTQTVKIQDNDGVDLQTLMTKTDQDSNVDANGPVWSSVSFDLMAYKGQTIRIAFESSQTDASKNTLFGTDLVSLQVK